MSNSVGLQPRYHRAGLYSFPNGLADHMHASTACYVGWAVLQRLLYFNYFYPLRQCQLLEAVNIFFAHVSSLATCLSWCSVKLALWHESPRSAVNRCTSEKHVSYHGTTTSVLVQKSQRQRASSVTPKRVPAAEQHVYTTQSFQQTQPLSPDNLQAVHGRPVSTRARNAVP